MILRNHKRHGDLWLDDDECGSVTVSTYATASVFTKIVLNRSFFFENVAHNSNRTPKGPFVTRGSSGIVNDLCSFITWK